MRYVGLLRAVNLGAKRKVPMAELRALMTDELGFEDVVTLVQSGNVVFSAPRTSAAGLGRRIGDALEARYGFEVPTMIRTGPQLDAVITAVPVPGAGRGPHEGARRLRRRAHEGGAAGRGGQGPVRPEDFTVGKAEVYLAHPDGAGRSKMNVPFEKLLGVRLTARNWNTVLKLADLLSEA